MRHGTIFSFGSVCLLLLVFTSPTLAQDFIRGDMDGDGRPATISDARTFGYSFGPHLCELASDANDDGLLNLGDQIYLLGLPYPMAPPIPTIPAPGPSCGPDPTPGGNLTCTTYTACNGWTPPPVTADRVFSVGSALGAVGGTVTVEVTLDVLGLPEDPGVGAYSFGIEHDPSIASVVDVRLGSGYPENSPDFFAFEITPNGFTATMLLEFIETTELHGIGLPIHEVDYFLVAEGTTPLSFQAELGSFPIPLMVVNTRWPMFRETFEPTTVDGSLTAEILPFFRRGDANDDGVFDIADPIAILNGLFMGPPLPCDDAVDSNDDGGLNIADAIHGLGALFAGGPQPPAPGPEVCSWDPTPDSLVVCISANCP